MTPRRKILPLFIPHLGCPHHCVFCDQKRISGSLLPARAEDVTSAVEQALARGERGCQLAFYGGSFTALPVPEQLALLGAARPYLASGALCGIRLSTRPDAVDEPTLRRLADCGVDTVELGAQSMDNAVLALSGRGHRAEDVCRAAGLVKAAGFTLVLQMMTGLPGATMAGDIATARELIALRPHGVRIYPTVILRGTALERLWQQGQYTEHSVEQAVETCARLLPLFAAAEIPVIRLGLNPTEELSGGAVVGGAYHPALGELVKSRVLLHAVRRQLGAYSGGGALHITVAPGCRSQMIGQKRANCQSLMAEYGFSAVTVREEAGQSPLSVTISVAK